MTSRERVMAVFDGRLPDRVPMWCGMSPEFMAKTKAVLGLSSDEDVYVRFHDDFRRTFAEYAGPALPADTSVFGVARHGYGYGQPINSPLADASLEEIESYPWPDPDDMDISVIREQAAQWGGRYAVMGGMWSPFFHDAIDLLGMENMMILMYEEPERVHAVIDHIVGYYDAINRRIFSAMGDVLDIFFFGNDFGSQHGPLLGEKLFNEFMTPSIRRLCATAHEFGLRTMLHCCGSFRILMPAMIDAGVEAFQSLQPITDDMLPENLKSSLGDKVVFNGCVDSVRVLIRGDRDLARDETRRVLNIMKPGGRYILSASHDYILEETPVENVTQMFDTCLEEGVY